MEPDLFALTKEERRVILFLTAVALFGVGVSFLAKKYAPIKVVFCIDENIGKININKADQDDLMVVPGIGKKLAQRIIEYRNLNSKFKTIEELKNVKGFQGYRF